MTPQSAFDYCWRRHPSCHAPALRKIINVIFKLREKHEEVMGRVFMRWADQAACSLAAGFALDTVLQVSVINHFPQHLRAGVKAAIAAQDAEHERVMMTI